MGTKKWEYVTLEGKAGDLADLVARLNRRGQKGWELVGVIGIKKGITADAVGAILKREAREWSGAT